MLIKTKIPFVNENKIMKEVLKILNSKKLGFVVVVNDKGLTNGIFTDGDLKRLLQKKKYIDKLKIKSFMTKNPFMVEENVLATEILKMMNRKKLQVLVFIKRKKKTIGVIHIHNILKNSR